MKQLFEKENPIGYCLIPVLVFLLGKQVVYEILMMVVQAAQIQGWRQDNAQILVNGLADLAMIPVMWCCFVNRKSKNSVQAGSLRTGRQEQREAAWFGIQKLTAYIGRSVLLCLLGGAACLAGNGLLQMTGLTRLLADDYSSTMDTLYGGAFWIQVFWMVAAAPAAEELVYRKILYTRMRQYCGFLGAAAGASLVFGMAHGYILQGIYSFFLGILLCELMERYRSLYSVTLVHMAANLCSVTATCYVPLQNWLSDKGHSTAAALISVCVCILILGYLIKTVPKPDIQEENPEG